MVVAGDLPQIPQELLARARRWSELKRWERRELGQALRRCGLSYNEISRILPVHDGTLSAWCRDIELSTEQQARLREKRPDLETRRAVGQRLRRAAQDRHAAIRAAARKEARALSMEPLFAAGVAAYWSEGAKTRDVCFSNSDPELVLLFMLWAKTYLDSDASRFGLRMHLHAGQDEGERRLFWSRLTDIPCERFGKTYVKQEGSGHRKNLLYNGTVQVRMTKSRTELERVLGWIEGMQERLMGRLV